MTVKSIIRDFAMLSGDAIAICYRGADQTIAALSWINPAFTELFGHTQEDAKGKSISDLLVPGEHARSFWREVAPRFEREEEYFVVETWVRRLKGADFWANISIISLPKSSDGSHFSIAVVRDLTDLKKLETAAVGAIAQASVARERLLAAINAMPEPIAIWDKDFRLVVCNTAFARQTLGCDDPPVPGERLSDVLKQAAESGIFKDAVGDEENWQKRAMQDIVNGPSTQRTEYSDGRVFKTMTNPVENGDVVVLSTETTYLEQSRAQLEKYAEQLEDARAQAIQQAVIDDLTGLENRRGLVQALTRKLATRRKNGGEVAALQIDVDRFKQINDTMGHAAGDQVLRVIADRLRECVGPDDVVSRMGGDEFVVLTSCDSDGGTAVALGEHLVDHLSQPTEYDGRVIRINTSIGLARTPLSPEIELLTNADIALYKSKAQGRRRCSVFEDGDLDEMQRTKSLADDLMRAVEEGEFEPYFQPQVDSSTGQVVALETLVRWHHPSQGLLSPDAFLGVAEDINLMSVIDNMMFERSMECAGRLEDQTIGMAFNISDARLMGTQILDAASAVSNGYSVAFELLETIYFEDESDAVLFRIDALRDTGISIEVDDFGSGRASIVALQRIAPDRLKIDRRLVAPIVTSESSRKLVRSIADIGHALDIAVTAEGVETAAHAEFLRDIGCDRLQGFHISRPMPFDELCVAFDLKTNDGKSRPKSNKIINMR